MLQNAISDGLARWEHSKNTKHRRLRATGLLTLRLSGAVQVLECMNAIDEQQPDWGITFFEYDWFSATRQAVAREFRYDTFITVYMSDCDYYPRVSSCRLVHQIACKDRLITACLP